jgi:Family of unknown function (DUF5335)
MSTTGAIATREIPADQWIVFLAEFTRENRGAHARLEIVGADCDTGYQVETDHRLFAGVSADVKDRGRTVWVFFGGTGDDHITHGVYPARTIHVVPANEAAGPILEIEAENGTKTILTLTKPGEFSLPRGEA